MDYIKIQNLNFSYESKLIFENISLDFQSGKRYVLAGLNGCGKSTLLKIIGGKVLCPHGTVSVKGEDPFRKTICNSFITYVNNEWGMRTVAYCGYNLPLQSSITVKEMSQHIKRQFPERNQELIKVLDINEEWRLNSISEGQRKRVQLYLNLIKPFDICLLDEITVNLDILVKDKLLQYLKKESIENNSCIIYVTHIFDGLDDWFSDLIYINKKGLINEVPQKEINIKGSIYSFLLENFKQEEKVSKNDWEQKSNELHLNNAGGYSDGVLINFIRE